MRTNIHIRIIAMSLLLSLGVHFSQAQPSTNLPNSHDCNTTLSECEEEIINFIAEIDDLTCSQWKGACGGDNTIYREGKVGIGGAVGGGKLTVHGDILTEQFKVDINAWADYVFESDYALMSLEEVNLYIQKHGHLPNIPSAEYLEKNGLSLEDIIRLQQEKIEEAYLYLIELEKETLLLEAMLKE